MGISRNRSNDHKAFCVINRNHGFSKDTLKTVLSVNRMHFVRNRITVFVICTRDFNQTHFFNIPGDRCLRDIKARLVQFIGKIFLGTNDLLGDNFLNLHLASSFHKTYLLLSRFEVRNSNLAYSAYTHLTRLTLVPRALPIPYNRSCSRLVPGISNIEPRYYSCQRSLNFSLTTWGKLRLPSRIS